MKPKNKSLFLVLFSLVILFLIFIFYYLSTNNISSPLKAYQSPTPFPTMMPLNIASNVSFINKPGASALLSVNKKPFFPIGIYYLAGPDNDITWNKIKDAGLNTLVDYGTWDSKTAANTFSQAEKRGLKIIAGMGQIFPEYANCKQSTDLGNLSLYIKSPSLIGLYGLDEPNLKTGLQLNDCWNFHQYIKRRINIPIWEDFYGYWTDNKLINDQAMSDIVSFDINNAGDDIKNPDADVSSIDFGSGIKNYLDRLKNNTLGKNVKSVWIVLPAHSEKSKLNLQVMSYQVFDSVINGATGVFWWDWPYGCTAKNCPGYVDGYKTGYEKHWETIKKISGQLNYIMPGLVGTTQSVSLFRITSWRIFKGDNQKTYIVALNKSPSSIPNFSIFGNLPANKTFFSPTNNQTYSSDSNGYLLVSNFPARSAMVLVEQ